MSYKPAQKFAVILFRDSIYYIKRPRMKAVLMRCSKWLSERGVLALRIWNGRGKLREFVNIIEKNFDVVDECRQEQSGAVVLVFRCHAGFKVE